ncbi:MAG: TRAP transporter permease [Paracoccaceae bacterium]|nr:TRAP transporter permease [Paracoccaceae bacterium]
MLNQDPKAHSIPYSAACFIGLAWALFQLWYASPIPFIVGFGVFIDVPARALHLGFALCLVFLLFRGKKKNDSYALNVFLAFISLVTTFYLFSEYKQIVDRNGVLLAIELDFFNKTLVLPLELLIGAIGILLLLEATRRAIGLPLVIVAILFYLYSFYGQNMPVLISHQGLSLNRLVGYHWFGGEAIFGIPISVSVSFVFLFVLFGTMLDFAGGGRYFLNLAIALVGKYRGGPAKASILASGMTGMVSGSSIANVVTTGTFTIPTMKKTGFSGVKAGAIEVAASVNGQIMPPIMGAAAFIMAEMLGITYFQVITHAFIPAIIVYLSLFWISDLEASKLGLTGMEKSQIPDLWPTFLAGLHHLIPIIILIYLLIIEQWTAGSSIFYSILSLMIIMITQKFREYRPNSIRDILSTLFESLSEIFQAMIKGSFNMAPVAVAIGAAGIVVGAVGSTGLSNAMIEIVEVISGGNIVILLAMVMVLCLILGLGLPTTANYLVVAALMANVIVEIGGASGLVLPLIAVHLYVFYFGLMADVTPPVGLAAYAASAISRADPIKTGIQAFYYEIRTAILPIVFIFNPELLLIGIKSLWHGLLVFFVSLVAILSFTSATQGWLLTKLKWYEIILLLLVSICMFRPDYVMNKFIPSYISYESDLNEQLTFKNGESIRFHITRHTDYGPRYKLFTFPIEINSTKSILDIAEIEVIRTAEGKLEISNLTFMGEGEKRGLDFYDEITDIDISSDFQPPKELIYILGLFLLSMVIVFQKRRLKKV